MWDAVDTDLEEMIARWSLPGDGSLLDRIERMIEPVLWSGIFTPSTTARVGGLQYHLGGARDTAELAELAGLGEEDR